MSRWPVEATGQSVGDGLVVVVAVFVKQARGGCLRAGDRRT
jgi:hypothetical protein